MNADHGEVVVPDVRAWLIQRRLRVRPVVAGVTALLVVATLIPVLLAVLRGNRPEPPRTEVPAVAVKAVESGVTPAPPEPEVNRPPAAWPAAAVAEVVAAVSDRPALAAKAGGRRGARAGDLPVWLGVPRPSRTGGGAATRLRVSVLGRADAAAAGVRGLALRVDPLAGPAGEVTVTVDYSGFRSAFGADWSSRLRLLALPECALTTPQRPQCARVPVEDSRNNPAAGAVSGTVDLGAGSALLLLEAGPSGPAGDYTATPLQPSSTWSAGGNSGTFAWSYPMRTPPSVGGPAPKVELSYSSQSVDGRHAASNNQPSQVGEGFELNAGGFIERRYKSCGEDMGSGANNTVKTGDQCWATDNAILSLAGHSGELIYNATEGRWHLRGDDGSRVQRFTGADNGDNDGEYWIVTTSDGVQYWFGAQKLPGWTSGDPVTNSVYTVPVFGNHSGEPCHAATFAASSCSQAWRWSLDYVVDLHGNSMSYWYVKETNKYGRNNTPGDAVTYVRGGWLEKILYGTRRDGGVDSAFDTDAPARVVFTTADRCLANCANHEDENAWPDTPWDQECTGSTCTMVAPTFWTTRRVATIATQIRGSSGYENVERWTLTHTFPDPGDTTRAGLWLDRISHEGLRGGTATVPDITFTGLALNNRVDSTEGIPAMNWWRIARIDTETGGAIAVTYSDQECHAGDPMPAPHSNTKRCYPVKWIPEGQSTPITDWFHKYVVTEVRQADTTGGNPEVLTTYTYLDGAAWHYTDDDGLVKPEYKTWSDWRGYGRVGVTVGEDPQPGQRTYTETRYFRGMHGDKQPSGTRTVTLPAAGNAPAINDEDWWAGMSRETIVYNGPGGPVVTRTITQPWASSPTATRTINGDTVTAHHIGIQTTWTHTARDGGRPDRITKTVNTFDTQGMVTTVEDLGEDGVAGDETCTTTTYEPRNTTAWLTNLPHRVRSFAVDCTAAANPASLGDADAVSDLRYFYDGHSHGVAPTLGDLTKTEKMATFNAGNLTWVTVGTKTYDVHGRIIEERDALNNLTTTSYTPATGGPVTGITVTNPLNHVTVTTVDPGYGSTLTIVDPNQRRTDLRYDPLGRLTGVWLADRDVDTQTASLTFSYTMQATAPSYVTTQRLNPAGIGYIATYELYDALLRPIQTQRPSPAGGRILTNTFYDKLGRAVETYSAYAAPGTPSGTLALPADPNDVPTQNRTIYDGANRATAMIFEPYNVERWRTSTTYGGDRTDVTPPDGGTATSTITDARGNTIALRQYHDPDDVGSNDPADFDQTTYTYNRKNQLTQLADSAGNTWTYTYDLRGRKVTETDPDRGTTTYGYDNADRLTSVTDARNVKLVYTYDVLNRKTAVYQNIAIGTPRAAWAYDIIAKGQLYQSVRNSGGSSYVSRVTGYTSTYEPTGHQIIIPAAETGLAGTYTYSYTYNPDGSRATTTVPAAGGLPQETLHHNYDALGLPTTLTTIYGTTAMDYVAATDYNALGQVDAYTLDTDPFVDTNDQVEIAYGRELETSRLTQLYVGLTAAPWVATDRRYSYDDAGNITSIADVTPNPDDTQCFTYDYLRRLTHAWTPVSGDCQATRTTTGLGGPAPYWHSWTYDATGNRLTQTIHAATGNTTTTYTYPAAGNPRPHTVTQTSTTTGGGTPTVNTYTYDSAGNTTSRPATSGTQTLTWDAEGHLASTSDPTGATSYVYDADGNRLISRDPTGKTLYLPGQELRYTTATGSISCTRYYTHNNQTIASRTPTGLTWLAGDHQQTQTVAVDATTLSVTQRRQTPFGEPRGTTPTWPNTRGFVNGTNDPTGLTHIGAREYDPTIGRFISDDPVTDTNDPQQINGYPYANNTPITASDPSGLIFCGDEACNQRAIPKPGGGHTVVGKPELSIPVCSGRFCVGSPRDPVSHGPEDDDFVYDPSLKPTLDDYISWNEWQMKRRLCILTSKVGIGPCAGWEDAPYMYARYLENTGTDYVFDYEQAASDDPSIAADINMEIADAQQAAEALFLATGDTEFSMTGAARNIPHSPITEEWQKALGSYDIWSSAEVTVTGDIIAIRLTIHAEDRWNFNRGAKDIATGIPDDVNGRFAELGWAKAFNTSGTVVRDVVWTIGSGAPPVVGTPMVRS